MKDTNLLGVYNGPSVGSDDPSTTSKTPRREIRTTLESGQDDGIWGGHTEAERRAIKRRRRPAPPRSAVAPDPELAAVARSATTAEKRQHARRAIEERRQPRTAVAAAFAVSTRTLDRWLAHERDRTPCPA